MTLLEPLTKEQVKNALSSSGYTRQQLDSDVEHLKEWLKQQHHLPPSRLKEKDAMLEMYLTGCKGSMETAKRKLDAYYTYRSQSEELYGNRDPNAAPYHDVKDVCHMALLPKTTKDGVRITVSQLADSDPDKFDYANCTKRVVNLLEMRMRMEGICGGDYIVWDAGNFSAGHVLKLIPTVIRDIIYLAQEIAPLRIRKIFFINTAPFLDVTINNLAKPFMTKKIKERVYVTSNGYEELFKHFDRSILPKDFGGDEPKTLQELSDGWLKRETLLRDWFRNELSELTDESKRINKDNHTNNAFFGLQGSLKKLIID